MLILFTAHLYPASFRDASQSTLEGQPSDRAIWHSVKTMSILPNIFSLSNTKVLVFPDIYPLFRTDWSWMDIYKPHGSLPASCSKCAVWGAWPNGDQSKWNCILTISNRDMAETYVQILNEVISSGVSSELLSHWLQSLHYLYILGLNNTRLIVRDAMKTLHELVRHILAQSTLLLLLLTAIRNIPMLQSLALTQSTFV